MAPKQQLEKAAWEWSEKTRPEDVSVDNIQAAYRLALKPCELNSCRKNCVGNPFCLNGLGIKKWIEQDENELFNENPVSSNSSKRSQGDFVGLENLGATCYINAFLQVWFHNRELRMAVFKWADPDNEGIRVLLANMLKPVKKKSLSDFLPKSPCGHLQLLFALLAFSKRKFIDPRAFIDCLEIDIMDQQDAQEFSKLFLALLEKDVTMRSVIQRQYMGTYDYITSCKGCGREAVVNSSFYELDLNIQGHNSLEHCINEYFQEQLLKGENMYDCKQCGVLQEAIRRVQLRSLPPVLNFQLLRFIFESGRKKKLNNFITFPETLDLSRYLPGAAQYDLFAVLIHSGGSASSGHYTALIKDPVTRSIYKFNDTLIEKFTDTKFDISKEEEIGGIRSTGTKRPPSVKGRHSSRNAYMLVYQLQSLNTNATYPEITIDMLPERVGHYVSIDNQLLEEEIDGVLAVKDKRIKDRRSRLEDIRESYTLLISLPDDTRSESCEWIPTEWLVKWFDNDVSCDVPAICNSRMMCSHHSMDPNKVDSAKLVPSVIAEKLFSIYGGDERLLCSQASCKECVVNRCFIDFNKAKINETDQQLKQYLKSSAVLDNGSGQYFWVNKVSLKQWRTLAMNALLKQASTKGICLKEDQSRDDENIESKQQTLDTDVELNSKASVAETNSRSVDVDDENEDKFNEAVQCSHGNLCLEAKTRLLLPSAIWNRLIEFLALDTYVEISDVNPVCVECKYKNAEETELVRKNRDLASTQKAQLLDLFLGKKRPNCCCDVLFIVPSSFVNDWRKFIRDPIKYRPVKSIENQSLLCCHNKCAFDLPTDSDTCPDSCVTLVNSSEWETIKDHFSIDLEIRRDFRYKEEALVPGVCEECRGLRRLNEYQSLFIYENAPIFIQRVTEVSDLNFTIEHNTNGEMGYCDAAGNFRDESVDECVVDVSDTNEQVLPSIDRKRKTSSYATEAACSDTKICKIDSLNQPRRSSRRRDRSTEKQFIVSSSQTLLQLKLELAVSYKVLKTDQHVYLNGRELTDDNATLQELRVQHNSVLLLKVDEPTADAITMDTYHDPRENGSYVAERGFKGTLLGV